MIYIMNTGAKLELDFVTYINNRKYLDLNSNLQSFIKYLFFNVESNDIISCRRINGKVKTDIIISCNKGTKNISIKTGSQNSVHSEKLSTFISFLKKIQVSNVMIENLLLYHFGDGTIDGTGIKRISAENTKIKYSNQIKKFNFYINKHKNFDKIIDRILFSGRLGNKSIDAIYYGNIEYGVWCSKNDLINFFKENHCLYLNTPHFSSLTYQNWCRNIKKDKKSEDHRYYIQIKWFSILADIEKAYKCEWKK